MAWVLSVLVLGAACVWVVGGSGRATSLRAHLDQVLHTVVLPGLTRLNSEGARLNR